MYVLSRDPDPLLDRRYARVKNRDEEARVGFDGTETSGPSGLDSGASREFTRQRNVRIASAQNRQRHPWIWITSDPHSNSSDKITPDLEKRSRARSDLIMIWRDEGERDWQGVPAAGLLASVV